METDWNKLIERYLQNELSEEGREAFEHELGTNPELKMEYDLHLMIMGSAVRSAERMEIAGIGKRFHFRKKLANAAIISGGLIILSVAAYVAFHSKKPEIEKPKLAENMPEDKSKPEVQAVCGGTSVSYVDLPLIRQTIASLDHLSDTALVEPVTTVLPGNPNTTTTPEKEDKGEKKQDPKRKYWITTVRASQLQGKSSTREEKPFHLAGNYTWANEFMIMDTPQGLYMFDTVNKRLTIFKSDYRTHHSKYGEMVLFGFKHRKYLTDVYQNRIIYENKESQ